MTEIIQHDYNGFLMSQRKSDGYTCLTDMAKATNRKVAKYFELKSTTAYLEGLSADIQIRISELVEISKGGNQGNEQGTWVLVG
ncbi:KilA-N domain-containing protein [Leptothoe sp. ISB3NOV94-8A]